MDEQGYRFGVGVLVVATVAIAVILVLFFGAAPNFFAQRYLVTIRFDAAPGVAADTPVRKNGVQIGRVQNVQLLEDSDGVDLTLELDSQYKVRAGELPRIGTGSIITGDAVVEFVKETQQSLVERFDGTGGSPQNGILDENEQQQAARFIQDGDFISGGRVAPDPLDALFNIQESFGTTLAAIERASDQVTGLAGELRTMVGGGDGELQRIGQQVELTITNFNNTLAAIEGLFNDPNLKDTIEIVATNLPELVEAADGVMLQAKTTLATFEGAGLAAEETMRNVAEFTKPFGNQGEQIVTEALQTIRNVDALLVDLRTVSATVNRVVNRVNDGQGTLAKLVDDDQLYFSLVSTLENVETLTRRLQPVVDDVRVFSDKISRNPSRLIDVQGVLMHRPNGGIK